jgi:hypothetical protein
MADTITLTSLTTLEAQAAASLEPGSLGDPYLALSGALRDIFISHESARRESGVEQAMIDALYAFNSLYQPTKLAELEKAGMSTTYFGLTGEKCTDALSWLLDVFLGESSKPWRLKATPVPEVPEELSELALSTGIQVAKEYMEGLGREPAPEDGARAASLVRQAMQDAILIETDRRAKQMERQIDDQLTEGGWGPAIKDFLFDVAVGKAAILKGPVVRERQKKVWGKGDKGRPKVSYAWQPTTTVSRVSPFDAYPAASTVGFEGDFIERIRYRLSDLFWMLKQKHFVESQVRSVISEFQSLAGSDVRVVDSTVAPVLQGQTGQAKVQGTVEGLDYWLTVTGAFLRNAGWKEFPSGKLIDEDKLYHIEALTVAGRIVFLEENPDPSGQKPYFKTGWQAIPGSFWYKCLPEILKDIGDVCNADARALVNNMGLASGFQVIIPDIQRLLGDKLTTMFPHKIWQFKNPTNSSALPIDFKQPDSNAQELLGIINECRQWADSRSGVPKYLVGGEPPPGVGRTASGISMLLNSAAKGIRRVVIAIDLEVICPILERIYEKNLMNSPDASVLGDLEVAPAGAVETLVKAELAERRLALIGELSKSPDAELVGIRGRSNVWREAFRSVEMDGASIMVPIEKIEQKAEAIAKAERTKAEAEAQAMQMEAQNKSLEVEISKAKLDVEKQRLAMESKILGLKLEAQITENQQRAAITKKMSSSIDLKTAEQLGEIGVKNDEEKENESVPAKSSGVESLGVPPAVPGVSGTPVALEEELPGVPGEFAPVEGGEFAASPGSGPVAEVPV